MDTKVNEIDREVKEISSSLSKLSYKLDVMQRQLDSIVREVGAGKGRDLDAQINGLETKLTQLDPLITETARDARAARKLVEYGDVRLKEIMQALAIIYRNTDELESGLLDAESLNTNPNGR